MNIFHRKQNLLIRERNLKKLREVCKTGSKILIKLQNNSFKRKKVTERH